jgi:hypothetical protein
MAGRFFFRYRPLEDLREWLTETFQVLAPTEGLSSELAETPVELL